MKDFWNQRYNEEGFAYGIGPNDFLVSQVKLIRPAGDVLCLAEGEGRNALFLARQGLHVTAVDFSEVGLEKIQKRSHEEGLQIETRLADLATFDLGLEKWDAIISIFAHLPSEIRKPLHSRVEAGLKMGGLFILEAYRPEQLSYGTGGPPHKDMMLTQKILRQELPTLKPEFQQEIEREIHEGKYHNGLSSVIQFRGRK